MGNMRLRIRRMALILLNNFFTRTWQGFWKSLFLETLKLETPLKRSGINTLTVINGYTRMGQGLWRTSFLKTI